MSTYYYIFDQTSSRCLFMGSSRNPGPNKLIGPSVSVGGHRYRLPTKWLDLLQSRFMERHPDARLIDEYEMDELLSPIEEADPEGVHSFHVGGDTIYDIPMSEYLPEVDSPEFLADLKADPALFIR